VNGTIEGQFRIERISPTIVVPGEEITIETAYCPINLEGTGHDSWVVLSVVARSRFSDTPNRVEFHVRGLPVPRDCTLSFEPMIDFGPVATFTRAERRTRLSNSGFETCQVEFLGPTRTSTAFQLEEPAVGTTKPIRLHEELEVRASFSPTALGNQGDRLVLSSNDPSWPSFNIALVGLGFSEPGFTVEVENDVPLVFGGALPLLFLPDENDGSARIQLPFAFEFLARRVSEVYVSTNGFISFDPNGADRSHSEPIPSASAATGMIAWWWDDLDSGAPDANATFVWNRRGFQFNFVNVPLRGGPVSARVNARISLHTSNVITVHYGEITDPSGSTFQASAGWNASGGTHGADVLGCSPTCGSADWPTNTVVRYIPYGSALP
jgi:hypothetical protein